MKSVYNSKTSAASHLKDEELIELVELELLMLLHKYDEQQVNPDELPIELFEI